MLCSAKEVTLFSMILPILTGVLSTISVPISRSSWFEPKLVLFKLSLKWGVYCSLTCGVACNALRVTVMFALGVVSP